MQRRDLVKVEGTLQLHQQRLLHETPGWRDWQKRRFVDHQQMGVTVDDPPARRGDALIRHLAEIAQPQTLTTRRIRCDRLPIVAEDAAFGKALSPRVDGHVRELRDHEVERP